MQHKLALIALSREPTSAALMAVADCKIAYEPVSKVSVVAKDVRCFHKTDEQALYSHANISKLILSDFGTGGHSIGNSS